MERRRAGWPVIVIGFVFFFGFIGPLTAEGPRSSDTAMNGNTGLVGTREVAEDLLKALNDRRIELDKREEALRREEEKLRAIRIDIENSLKKNAELRAELKKMADAGKKPEGNMGQLVKAYETMAAEEAASRLEAMDQKLAVDLLSRMKGKTVANIFANMSTTKAAALSSALVKR